MPGYQVYLGTPLASAFPSPKHGSFYLQQHQFLGHTETQTSSPASKSVRNPSMTHILLLVYFTLQHSLFRIAGALPYTQARDSHFTAYIQICNKLGSFFFPLKP